MPEKSKWHAMPRWKRRLHGFASYQLAAFVSLFAPERVDGAMYHTLRDQFDDGAKSPKA